MKSINKTIKVLLIGDNHDHAQKIRSLLEEIEDFSFRLDVAERLSLAMENLAKGNYDVILLDVSFSDSQGAAILKVNAQAPTVPIIILSSFEDKKLAVKSVLLGAQDYLIKGQLNSGLLGHSIYYAIERKLTETDLKNARHDLEKTNKQLMQEILERKQVEKELQIAKKRAEAANQAKSEFIAKMSHEIRTPMNGIVGATEIALNSELTSKQRKYWDMVKDLSDQMLVMINDILEFSKIEAGKLVVEQIHFNLRNCINNTVKSLAVQAEWKGLELTCSIPPDIPDALIGDPGRLKQVIINLISNAIKFSKQGTISLRLDKESQVRDNIVVSFYITDQGIGIPAEKQGLIFEAFSQADESTTRKYGGTGLGLTICAQLVKMMNGRIRVESLEGKGSAFHFTACFGLQSISSHIQIPLDMEILHDMPVMIVDDNLYNLGILDELLDVLGMQPILSESGVEALSALENAAKSGKKPFPLAIIDYCMPEMDGFTLARKIKQNPQIANTIIIMLTSAGYPGDATRCRELGISGYLTKPVKGLDLLDCIVTALSNSSQRYSLITRHSLSENRQQMHLLLAKFTPDNQEDMTVDMLNLWGHTVTVANNGKETLEALEKEAFDLLLIDMQGHEKDSFQITRAIRDKEKITGRHILIIALIAYTDKEDRERCLKAGMDGHVAKSVDEKELYQTIEEIIPQVMKHKTNMSYGQKAMNSS